MALKKVPSFVFSTYVSGSISKGCANNLYDKKGYRSSSLYEDEETLPIPEYPKFNGTIKFPEAQAEEELTLPVVAGKVSNLTDRIASIESMLNHTYYTVSLVLDPTTNTLVGSCPYAGTVSLLSMNYPPFLFGVQQTYTVYIGVGSVISFVRSDDATETFDSFMLDVDIEQGASVRVVVSMLDVSNGEPIADYSTANWNGSLSIITDRAIMKRTSEKARRLNERSK